MMVDGIRMPHSFDYSSASVGRGDYVELDGIGQIEILKGPSSTQYGSDGLAAAVNFKTVTADQLLKDREKTAVIKAGYRSINESSSGSVRLAQRGLDWSALLISSLTSGAQTINQGIIDVPDANRTKPNPENNHQRYLLAKIEKQLSGAQNIVLTLEDVSKYRKTNLYTARTSTIFDHQAKDQLKRQRISIDVITKKRVFGFEDESLIKFWLQQARVNQLSIEDRQIDRSRDNNLFDNSFGINANWVNYQDGEISRKWTYGFDVQQSRITQAVNRSGDYDDVVKYFPDTQRNLAGLYTQLELDGHGFSLIPAIRFDRYQFKSSQAGYALPVVNLSDSAISPSISGIWKWRPLAKPYISWSKGFRAPTQDQVNNGFSNLRHGYTSIGNKNLKSEKAYGLEVGIKGMFAQSRYTIAAYSNQYRDFIEQRIVGGTARPTDPLIYQYINRSQATIQGLDLRLETVLNLHWTLTSGWVYSRGRTTSDDGQKQPIDTIQPMRASLGLSYQQHTWKVAGQWLHTWAKRSSDVGTVTDTQTTLQVPQYVAPSYSVLNLKAQWQIKKDLNLSFGINNLFDKKYWRWSDVRGLEAASPVADAYTAPGRNISVALRYDL
jgi:hemoglobin/transferrin/lactoferrin receptor protein